MGQSSDGRRYLTAENFQVPVPRVQFEYNQLREYSLTICVIYFFFIADLFDAERTISLPHSARSACPFCSAHFCPIPYQNICSNTLLLMLIIYDLRLTIRELRQATRKLVESCLMPSCGPGYVIRATKAIDGSVQDA